MKCLKYKIEIIQDEFHQWKETIDEIMYQLADDRFLNINKYAMFTHDGSLRREGNGAVEIEVSAIDKETITNLFILVRSNQEVEDTIENYKNKICQHVFENAPYVKENMESFSYLPKLTKLLVVNHRTRYPNEGYCCDSCGVKMEKDQQFIPPTRFKIPVCETCYNAYYGEKDEK